MESDSSARTDTSWLRSRWQQEHGHDAEEEDLSSVKTPTEQRSPSPISLPGRSSSSPKRHASFLKHRRKSSGQTNQTYKDHIEKEQGRRQDVDSADAALTELQAPDPIDRSYSRTDSLEYELTKAKRKSSHHRSDRDGEGEGFLTEVAAQERLVERESEDEEKAHTLQPPSQDSGEKKGGAQPVPQYSRFATEFYTITHLVFFSILGTLARLGTEAITKYPQTPFISPVLWANLGGSFFLGFLIEDRRLFREEWGPAESTAWSVYPSNMSDNRRDSESHQHGGGAHGQVKKTIPLYIGLATGFCGSYTSFSSYVRDAFLALANFLPSQPPVTPIPSRNGGYSFEATVAILIIDVSVSISALYTGAHLALACDRILPTLPFRFVRHFLNPFLSFLAIGSWLGAIFLAVFPPQNFWRGRVTFALVFAPIGCLLRFYASMHLNGRIPAFPLGTFAVNIFGTAVLGMCFNLQHSPRIGALPQGRVTTCQVLDGIMEGFCGCTTTVSTWVAELTSLRRRHAYVYGLVSVNVALGLLVVIMGSMSWTIGFADIACSV